MDCVGAGLECHNRRGVLTIGTERKRAHLRERLLTPKADRPGPTARINTFRGMVPEMMKPIVVVSPAASTVRTETFPIGTLEGRSARLNVPVDVWPFESVVYEPPVPWSKVSVVDALGVLPTAGVTISAVLGPVTA